MGLWSRLRARWARPGPDATALPDPREELDRTYAEQLTLLQHARRSLADVATSRARLQQRAAESRHQAELLRTQAEQAVATDRDDLALELLTRAAALAHQRVDHDRRLDELRAQEDDLAGAVATLAGQVEQLRTARETLSAQYTAATAQATISGALAGLTGRPGDPGAVVRALEDETLRKRAEAAALAELAALQGSPPPAAPAALPAAVASAQDELARLQAQRESAPGDPQP
jgi:phage shock protein A